MLYHNLRKGKFAAPATRLCRGMKKGHVFLSLALNGGV